MPDWAQQVKDELAELGTPTAAEARQVTGAYEPADVTAALHANAVAGGGGGGGAPMTVERLGGNATSVGDGNTISLTWDNSTGPDTLLDRSTPAQPLPLEPGDYIISVSAAPYDAVTVGGGYTLNLQIQSIADPTTNVSGWNSAVSTTNNQYPETGVTLPAALVVDSRIEARVTSYDGTGAVNYQIIGAVVAKLGTAP